ncbi:MAG: ATP-binding protein [Candidatus Altiarchaeota archaeon]|nr:ATP-binding protein [Candidatus Altiarchaeota archaeon]
MFKDRGRELAFLERLVGKPTLLVMYGRRRVGKTELLKEFARKTGAIYLLARRESKKDQLDKLSREMASALKDGSLNERPFPSYDALFEYIAGIKKPVIFDEFPYLVESSPELPSVLQDHWDNRLSKGGSYIVLCGSSVSMMEGLLGYKSPIYGRRTEQLLLEPLSFEDAREFLPGPIERQVEAYAVLGGTPGYLLELEGGLERTIKKKILQKNSFLGRDPEFVLREELSEPRNYFSIIKAVARGKTSLGEICSDTGLSRGLVVKYLSVLSDLQIIERRVPFGAKRDSRKGIYLLRDNYFRFWFRFAFENFEYIEQGLQDRLYREIITPRLDAFVGRAFEEICLSWARGEYERPFSSWWGGEDEIDGVAKGVLLEAKWKRMSAGEARKALDRLKEKAHRAGFKGKRVLCVKGFSSRPRLYEGERAVTVREMFK